MLLGFCRCSLCFIWCSHLDLGSFGLLCGQVLIQKGVSVNEIKLYGEKESDEALDDLSTEDNFSELEAIISKVCGFFLDNIREIYDVHPFSPICRRI